VINNPSATEPLITIKRDAQNEQHTDKTVKIAELEAELLKRNTKSQHPIFVQYETRTAWNVTYYDTPALPKDGGKEEEDLILALAKPAHRLLLAVDEVREGGQSELTSFIKSKLDPKLDRTVFAFTKLNDKLKGFTSSKELNRYFSTATSGDAPSFFVSLPGKEERAQFGSKDKFYARLDALTKDDLHNLEQLQYDRRYSSSIGVSGLRKHLQESTWQKYQSAVPDLLKRLRLMKKRSEEKLVSLETQISSLDANKLRGNASRFVMHFLQLVEKLLLGTLEGNPGINGQTLLEEKAQDETGDWLNREWTRIQFDPEEWKIPHASSKLYGGQQLERLLAEFKAVVDHTEMEDLSMDDIATATGPQKVNNAINTVWAASDIVQKQIQRALLPLLEQLFKRATYVMKRLVEVVDLMMDSERKLRKRVGRAEASPEEFENYPFFTHTVKDLFHKFVDATAESCKAKCMDEFLSTRIIYWERTALDGANLKAEREPTGPVETRKVVSTLALELFAKLRDRIARNVALKTYNFFLLPMQNELWTEVQGSITCMSDEQLKELFEVDSTTKSLKDELEDMKLVLGKFAKREANLRQYAAEFSKGNPRGLEL